MKKAKLFVTLLLSALMVFGVFGLTSFAADENADSSAHKWTVKEAMQDGDYAGGIAFQCTNPVAHDCDYYMVWTAAVLKAENTIYNGEEYDSDLLDVFAFDSEGKFTLLPDDFSFDVPQYYVDGKWTATAPTEAGEYDVRMQLIVNNVRKDLYVNASFEIFEPKVCFEDAKIDPNDKDSALFTYGDAIEPIVKAGDIEDLEYTLTYKSLDKRNAKYTKAVPKNVGHYRVKATFSNGGFAEADFTIAKNTTKVDSAAIKYLDVDVEELKEYSIDNKTVEEIIDGLKDMIAIKDDSDVPYGKVLFPELQDAAGQAVELSAYAPLTFKYAKLPDSYSLESLTLKTLLKALTRKTFVPGTTVLDAGDYFLFYSAPATKNHVAVSGSVSFKIVPVEAKIVDEPEARNLVANGNYQKLVTPGKAVGGDFVYSLTGEEGSYSKSIPTARQAGDYTVYYKLVGDKNHEDWEPESPLTVAIAEADDEDVVDPEEGKLVPAVKNVKANAGKRYFKVTWTKLSEENLENVDKIEIRYTNQKTDKTVTKSISKNKTSYKVSGLKRGTGYTIQVRTVKYNVKDAEGNLIPKAVSSDWEYAAWMYVKVK